MWPLHFIGTVYLTDEYECNGMDVSILLLLLHAMECAWEDICFDNFSTTPACYLCYVYYIKHFSLSHCLYTAPTFHLVRTSLAWITSCSHTPSRHMQVSTCPYLHEVCSKIIIEYIYVRMYVCTGMYVCNYVCMYVCVYVIPCVSGIFR